MTTPTTRPAEPAAGGRGAATVVLVDDSAVQRRFLRAVLDTEFNVVAEARTGREAVALVHKLRPAVVLMDLDLPVMNGIEAIEAIMAVSPTPILVYSAFVDGRDSTNAIEALAAGAVDIVTKPTPEQTTGMDEYAAELRRRVRVASRVRVITHPRGRLRAGAPLPRRGLASTHGRRPLVPAPLPPDDDGPLRPTGPFCVVAIGASTGGPPALATLLGGLPADFAPAVVVVQHMADGFIEGLAGWLNELCALPVSVGASGYRLHPGTVTVAPSGRNLLVHDRLRVSCEPPPATQFHVPGIDATFTSLARSVGAAAVGVVLTGMGRDGAAGLREMRAHGAHTIGQDQATSAVYGMPAAAAALDALDEQLPLVGISARIRALCAIDREASA